MTNTHDVALTGCTPEPLASYLKALGVLRLVATQADAGVRAYWSGDQLHLVSELSRTELRAFFTQVYTPSPLLSPWNGGSGFWNSRNAAGQALTAVERSTAPRLAQYRESIRIVRLELAGLRLTEAPDKAEKAAFLRRLRASLPDAALDWLDATTVLGQDRPRFAPVLGTGGNDGNLDFTANFMQRLSEVLPLADTLTAKGSNDWLGDALFATSDSRLLNVAIGQYHPGGAGGPNATQGFDGGSLVNPWDIILMFEGALLLAGAPARRLGPDATGKAAFPFTVGATAAGWGTVSDAESGATSRGEVWLPVWERPASYQAIRQLFAEGRAQVGRRQARTGLDFARAVSGLGVDKGIRSFQRFGFLKRNGLAYLAAPLGRLDVREQSDVRLIDEVDPWLDRLRWAAASDPSGSLLRAIRSVEEAAFSFCEQGGTRRLQEVLCTLGRTELALSRMPKLHDKLSPLSHLSGRWLTACYDESPEFRLAAALASIDHPLIGPVRRQLEPVHTVRGRVAWAHDQTSVVAGTELVRLLGAILERRLLEGNRSGALSVPLGGRITATLADVHRFLLGQVDDERVLDLVIALATLKWDKFEPPQLPSPESTASEISRAYAVLKLLFLPGPLRLADGAEPVAIPPEPVVANRLRAGNLDGAISIAYRRLRSSGLTPLGLSGRTRTEAPHLELGAMGPERILAALLVPIKQTRVLADLVLRRQPVPVRS